MSALPGPADHQGSYGGGYASLAAYQGRDGMVSQLYRARRSLATDRETAREHAPSRLGFAATRLNITTEPPWFPQSLIRGGL
jgi:hypothetical protein